MNVSMARLSLFVLPILVASCQPHPRNDMAEKQQSAESLWSVEDQEIQVVLSGLLAELDQTDLPPWAGRYVRGEGTAGDRLCIAPDSGFIWIKGTGLSCCSKKSNGEICSPDCPGGKEAVNGFAFETREGHIRLGVELEPGNVVRFGEFVTVRWGERTYLVPTDEIEAFRRAVKSGDEPRSTPVGDFYLSEGGEKIDASGEPVFGS